MPVLLWCVAWHQSVVCYLHDDKKTLKATLCGSMHVRFLSCFLCHWYMRDFRWWRLPSSRSRIQLSVVWIFRNMWKYSGQSIDSSWPSFNTAMSAGWRKCCDFFEWLWVATVLFDCLHLPRNIGKLYAFNASICLSFILLVWSLTWRRRSFVCNIFSLFNGVSWFNAASFAVASFHKQKKRQRKLRYQSPIFCHSWDLSDYLLHSRWLKRCLHGSIVHKNAKINSYLCSEL